MKQRLDQALVLRGLVSTRHQASGLVTAGRVKVGGKSVNKAGALVSADSELQITPGPRYVSRSALKLE